MAQTCILIQLPGHNVDFRIYLGKIDCFIGENAVNCNAVAFINIASERDK